jgi:hypothetical protein
MNKFFDWLGREVIAILTTLCTLCLWAAFILGLAWLVAFLGKGLLTTIGVL